jgi:hypothetical protein
LQQSLFNSANSFRIAAIVVAVLMALYSFTSLFSGFFSQRRPLLPADPPKIASQQIELTARWAVSISPFQADLDANYAMTLALQALRPDNAGRSAVRVQESVEARENVVSVLKAAPYNSALWVLLALLQAQRSLGGQPIIEILKMSYFTAPTDARLMPLRLYAVARSDALSDPDLRELVLGDVRLMLTRNAHLKAAVVSAYQHASSLGKTFLEESVRSIDPTFVPVLLSQSPT